MKHSKTAFACVLKGHLNRGVFYLFLFIGVCLIPFALAQQTTWRAPANIITVTNLNDSGPGALRQALADANDGDTINFAVTGTIALTSGELLVEKSVTVSGPGAASLAVDGNAKSRVFHIGSGKTVSISGLTLTNGSAASGNGGDLLNDHAILMLSSCAVQNSVGQLQSRGGGVYNDGSGGSATLTILSSTVSGNYAYSAGAGIFNDAYNDGNATLTIMNSIVSNNVTGFADTFPPGGQGGGICNDGGTLTITNSIVSNNTAGVPGPNFPSGYGGGISNSGTLTITNSTIKTNQCWLAGGGISNDGTLTVTSSTVNNNGANGQHDGIPWGQGGGISGTLTLTNSTVSGNYAALSGGGIDGGGNITNSTISGNNGGGISVSGTLEIGNTILNAGASGPNVSNGGTVISQGATT